MHMGKLLYILEDGSTTELIIGDGLVVENDTLKIVNSCVVQSLLNSFKLDEMLIS